MRKAFFCYLVLLAGLFGPQLHAQHSGPGIQFDNETFDMGRIAAGEVLKHEFIFTNTGNATLQILHVAPACGCTTAGEASRRVEPGATGRIPIQFNSSSFNGPVHKTVTVATNDKERPSLVLHLKAEVWRPVNVQPQYAVLTLGPDAEQASTLVRITNNTEQVMRLSQPISSNPAFKTELVEVVPGKEFHLQVTLSAPVPPGNTQAQLTMQTGMETPASINVLIWANVQQPVMVLPAQVNLPPGPLPAQATPSLIVRNNSSRAVQLTEATVNASNVLVGINEIQPGTNYNLVLTFPPGFEAPANEKLSLTIKTTHPKTPEIKIPVVQFPRATTTGLQPGR